MMIRVQKAAFDASAEVSGLVAERRDIGAVVSFQGLVRDSHAGAPEGRVDSMELQHYPAMTERALKRIAEKALQEFDIEDCLIIHRFGALEPGEPIVLVVTLAAHRKAAFAAAEFLIDYLKTEAPFWKKETGPGGSEWVEARDEDMEAARGWKS